MHVLITVFDPRDLQNSICALTLFAILHGKVVTFWRYVAIKCIFLEIV